jgi:hypothetical protein
MEDANDIIKNGEKLDEFLSYDWQLDEFEEALKIKDIPEIVRILNDYAQNDKSLPVDYVYKLIEFFQPSEPSNPRDESKTPGPKSNKRRLVFRNLEIASSYKTLCEFPQLAAQFVDGTDWKRFNSEMPFNESGIVIPPNKYRKKNSRGFKKPPRTKIKEKLQERVGLGRTQLEAILAEWVGYLKEKEKEERKILALIENK